MSRGFFENGKAGVLFDDAPFPADEEQNAPRENSAPAHRGLKPNGAIVMVPDGNAREAHFRRNRMLSRRARILLRIAILATICFLAASAPRVRAQVNIEKMRFDEREEGFSTDLTFSFSTRSGNVDITELGISLREDYVARKSTTFLLVRGMYGWQAGDAFSNEGLAHLRHVRKDWQKVSPEFFAQVDYDKARLLDFRSLGGGGIRIRFFEREKFQAAWGTAWMLEHERYDLPPDASHPRHTTDQRWSNYLSLQAAFGEKTTLTWTTYVQPRFDEFEDYKAITDAELDTDLVGRFGLRVTLRVRYDSRPPDTIEKRDIFFATGLRFEV